MANLKRILCFSAALNHLKTLLQELMIIALEADKVCLYSVSGCGVWPAPLEHLYHEVAVENDSDCERSILHKSLLPPVDV